MTAPLSPAETERLRRLAEAATPGPWKIDGLHCRGCGLPTRKAEDPDSYLHDTDCRGVEWAANYIEADKDGERIEIVTCDSGYYGPHDADLLLIAAADPETLRELLRGYEAWRDGIGKIEKRLVEIRPEHGPGEVIGEAACYREGVDDGLNFALDALRAEKR